MPSDAREGQLPNRPRFVSHAQSAANFTGRVLPEVVKPVGVVPRRVSFLVGLLHHGDVRPLLDHGDVRLHGLDHHLILISVTPRRGLVLKFLVAINLLDIIAGAIEERIVIFVALVSLWPFDFLAGRRLLTEIIC
jgi:hypothetical protein